MRLSYELAHTFIQSGILTITIYALIIVQAISGPDLLTGAILLTALFAVKAVLFLVALFLGMQRGVATSIIFALASSLIVTFYLTYGEVLHVGIEWYFLFGILLLTDAISRILLWDLGRGRN